MRSIGGALLVTCLLVGTGAALTLTQLPHQVATTLKPLATELGNSLSQLPRAVAQRIPKVDPQLPAAANQLAASATSFPQSVAEKVRNFFCRWLSCAALDLADSSRILNEDLTDIGSQQRATLPPNVKQPASIPSPTGDATTTTQVVASNFPASASESASPSASQPIIQPAERIVERVQTVIQTGLTETLLNEKLLALTNDLSSRLNQIAGARKYQAERTAQNISDALRIEQLTGLTARDLTVDGVSGLTDADLPDSLTASNYLPLSGGSLSGDLSLTGTLTAGTLSVAGLSSGGAIAAPYFTASSSTATSTFAGGVGIATTSPLDTLGVNGALGLGAINTNAIVNVRNAGTSASLRPSRCRIFFGHQHLSNIHLRRPVRRR